MEIVILSVGKPEQQWQLQAITHYLQKINYYTKVQHHILKATSRDKVEEQLLKLTQDSHLVLLDERGKTYSSRQFSQWIQQHQLHSTKKLSLIIGGADGHSETFRQTAHQLLKLSTFTLQHDIALITLLEQLYRAHTILKGEPYHRD
jgi:23S rRNA (pseudouridine1915-N3)-methyltransferase